MNIIDRFSTHLREVLTRSITLAAEIGNPLVEPIHLFFALSTSTGSIATEILNRFKIDPKIVEQLMANLPTIKKTALPGVKNTSNQAMLPSLSPACRLAIEKSILIAQTNKHNYVGTEHMLSALIQLPDNLLNELFKINNINIKELTAQIKTVLNNATQFPQIAEMAEVIERMQANLGDDLFGPAAMVGSIQKSPGVVAKNKETALEFFANNLTDPAVQKNIDPVIGRAKEIERLTQILCRRTKNNPILLGDPGVGKTAIVEGLAKKIMQGEVPDALLNKKIYALDMGILIAGTTFRGEFEARLQQIIEDIARDPNIILFIDEIHNIVGAGSNQGTLDAANILKPVLSRGQVRCIGATTPAEFKKYIESDAALERRFQPIYIKQSSCQDTIKILQGVRANYETYHRLAITDQAINKTVYLADRYISNKFLPDKAIDLLDETMAAKRLTIKPSTDQTKLWRLQKKLEQTMSAKEQAALHDDFRQAVKLKEEEKIIAGQIDKIKSSLSARTAKLNGTITATDIVKQLAKILNTPIDDLILDEKDKLKNLDQELKKYIIGQDEVLDNVSQIIQHSQLQLSNPNRPLASFIFVGESGVGKTELAKTLAQVLYPGSDALIKLDMSEFNESFSVSKILGSPAGYIGYKESNQFTDKVKMNPYSVILFDEIDKAHRDVGKLLLQMLENGEITDSTGRKISLKHAIMILTTTIGAQEANKAGIGFGDGKNNRSETDKILKDQLKEYFSPELINRLDKICLFNNLETKDLVKIAQLEIDRLNEQLKKYKTKIATETKIMNWLVKQLPDKKSNARDIRYYVRQEVEKLISTIILNKQPKHKYSLQKSGQKLAIR